LSLLKAGLARDNAEMEAIVKIAAARPRLTTELTPRPGDPATIGTGERSSRE
jgi:hypothetical protein